MCCSAFFSLTIYLPGEYLSRRDRVSVTYTHTRIICTLNEINLFLFTHHTPGCLSRHVFSDG